MKKGEVKEAVEGKVRDMQGSKNGADESKAPEVSAPDEDMQMEGPREDMVLLPLSTLNKVMGMIMQRPYGEVFQIMEEVKAQVKQA